MILRARLVFETFKKPLPQSTDHALRGLCRKFLDNSDLGKFILDAGLLCDIDRCYLMGVSLTGVRTGYHVRYGVEITVIDDGNNAALLRLFHDGNTIKFFDL